MNIFGKKTKEHYKIFLNENLLIENKNIKLILIHHFNQKTN